MADGEYPHRLVPSLVRGTAKLTGGGRRDPRVQRNRDNHGAHARSVRRDFLGARDFYTQVRDQRNANNLPDLPANTPFLLKIPEDADPEFLMSLGLEIVAETNEGIVLVSSDDVSAETFSDKIRRFETLTHGGGSIAQILKVISIEAVDDRLSRVLSTNLYTNFNALIDGSIYTVDVGIECQGTIQLPKYPDRGGQEPEDRYANRVQRRRQRYEDARDAIDDLQIQREQQLIEFIEAHMGTIVSITQEEIQDYVLPDSFTVRTQIPGSALKDLALNFPFVFDIQEAEEVSALKVGEEAATYQLEFDVLPPRGDAPVLSILDSGVQETHPMLEFAVSQPSSCLIPGFDEADVADYVAPSGHGTRVAGAALFHAGIPSAGDSFQAPFWLRNVRVLNEDNVLREDFFPALMVKKAVNLCVESGRDHRILNSSINANQPCRKTYMTAWAAAIDDLCHSNDVLIVTSTGNLQDLSVGSRLGVLSALRSGTDYPDYLNSAGCGIANPAQSFQALTVGAVNTGSFEDEDYVSLGGEGSPASYSASGPGLWNSIKPEVVAAVGDIVLSKGHPLTSRVKPETTLLLPRSTMHGGPLCDRDALGTSFAAGIVSGLAVELQSLYPDLSALTYKSLIVSSAMWPEWVDVQSRNLAIRTLGYGLIDRGKAIGNAEHRICLIQGGDQSIGQRQTHVYKVAIPPEVRAAENEVLVRVSVTLSFSAQPRRTRRSLKRYYSSWVDWKASRRNESFESLATRACKDVDDEVDDSNDGAFPWIIGPAANYGVVGITRSNSACQKDWFEIPAYELPEELGIAVTCHPGWDTDPESQAKYSLVIAFEALDQQTPIYAPIELALNQLIAKIEPEIEIQD